MNIALLIVSVVASALQTLPGVPPGLATGLNAVVATLGVIIRNGIGSGSPVTFSVILATLQGVITELKAVPGLNQTVLNDISILENALTAALAADSAAQQKVDPAQLHQEAPV